MNPNGGKSHLTPISQCLRCLTWEGSAGSFGLAGFFFFFGFGLATLPAMEATLPPGAAFPTPASATAAIRSVATAIVMRLIQPLLPRW